MAIQHPLATVDSASLNDLFAQIDEYQQLGPNWDGEDALPVGGKVALRTKSLLQRIADGAYLSGLRWNGPSVAPNPGGAVELSWQKRKRWLMLIVDPARSKVGCAVQENGAEPHYRSVLADEAVEQAVWVMREQQDDLRVGAGQ